MYKYTDKIYKYLISILHLMFNIKYDRYKSVVLAIILSVIYIL